MLFLHNRLNFNADKLTEENFLKYIKEKISKKQNLEEVRNWQKNYFFTKDSIYPKIFADALNHRIKNYDYPIEFVLNDTSESNNIISQIDVESAEGFDVVWKLFFHSR